MAERLQKLLAAAGYGSRREIERWIDAGRLTIGGRLARLGDQADPGEDIRLDGRRVRLEPGGARPRVIVYHKPSGEICTRHDPEGRPTVFDRLPSARPGRWIGIGRLDVNTCGLMLFTTDGERVHGEATAAQLAELRQGMSLEDGPARFERIEPGGGSGVNHWYRVVLREGRRREVRRLWEAIGLTVSRLIRVRFGSIELPRDLRRGRWRELDAEQRSALYAEAGLEPR